MKITNNDYKLLEQKYQENLPDILVKIDEGYPVQYAIGYVDFCGYSINVDERALIPRFETEGLLEIVIKLLKDNNLTNINVLDIGTGTGNIDIVLKKELPNLNITSIDISSDAISLAKENYILNNVDINTINIDVNEYNTNNKYSLIISNPPYVDIKEEVSIETKYEPQNAIFADNNGLYYYELILNKFKNNLTDKYLIAFEIGYNQGSYLKTLASKIYKDAKIEIKQDLSNRDRYLIISNF